MNAAVTRRIELKLRREGNYLIAGVDEVGIGPLAGPVVAAAVIVKDNVKIPKLDDSKKLTRKRRDELFGYIMECSESVGIGIMDSCTIDRVNILQASLKAMRSAIDSLSVKPQHILVDGIRKVPGIEIPQTPVKHGDRISHAIAAASVIAKVVRDRIMDNYDILYPQYDFADHKGYATKKHRKLLKKSGPCAIHRHSYEPVFEASALKGTLYLY